LTSAYLFAVANHVLDALILYFRSMPASTPKLDDLSLGSELDSSQLAQITKDLDTIAIAIAALTQIDREGMRQIAQDLQLESIVSDWVDEWSFERPIAYERLNIPQLRAIVLIVNHLAQLYQPLIRRTLEYWQQTVKYAQLPIQSPALVDYINNFITIYQARYGLETIHASEVLSATALNLAIGLLFYGGANGHKLLWVALLSRSHSTSVPPYSI
jgi:Protein of unknown function (DUF3038)